MKPKSGQIKKRMAFLHQYLKEGRAIYYTDLSDAGWSVYIKRLNAYNESARRYGYQTLNPM